MKALVLSSLLLVSNLQAQLREPAIPAADRKITDEQAGQIFKALRAVNFSAKEVVFPIFAGRQRIAYGVSIGDERLITKASEVVTKRVIMTVNRANEALAAGVVGIYPDHDLAIIKVPGLNAKSAQWADSGNLAEGAFLAAIRPDGEAQAMGVLSVRERSLKTSDQGFLGIQMDAREAGNGVRVEWVVEESAAAEVGIRAGDIITKIEGEQVRGFYELSTRLRRLKNGEQPEIELLRANNKFTVKPTLKGRDLPQDRNRQLDRMDRMSGTQSRVRGDFTNVLQSDMELEVNDAGLPIVDLEGRIVGLVIARAGRISTLILPGDDIEAALKTAPEPHVPSRNAADRRTNNLPEGGQRARMRRELERMRRMMENLQRELERE